MSRTTEDAMALLDEIAEHASQWPTERAQPRKPSGMHQVDDFSLLAHQITTLTKKVEAMKTTTQKSQSHSLCNQCGGGHPNHECQTGENVNIVGHYNRNNNYYNNNRLNSQRQRHSGFPWSNNNGSLNSWQPGHQGQSSQAPPSFQTQQRNL